MHFCSDDREQSITDSVMYPLDSELADKMSNISLVAPPPHESRETCDNTGDNGVDSGHKNWSSNDTLALLSSKVLNMDIKESS